MSISFAIDEVFEMAQQIERNGARFYREVSGRSKDAQTRGLLLALAAMEERHEEFFARRRKELAGGEGKTEFKMDEQIASYLRVWADGHVFNLRADPLAQVSEATTIEDILRMAIGLEKESIVFYLGLKDAMSRKADSEHLDEIIREEMRHIATLNTQLLTLKTDKA